MAARTVIFIGGTPYSGSTLLDLVLGHDAKGFSCGEVSAFIRPWRRHHAEPRCGCGDPACDIWPSVGRAGAAGLHVRLFERTGAEFVVDSSKDIFWIAGQARRLRRRGINVRHVLIWKTPLELAASFRKRGRGADWAAEWVRYHRAYLSMIDDFVAVRYTEFVQEDTRLAKLCGQLSIPCFEGKREYWRKTHHALFGNRTAKVHLREQTAAPRAAERTHRTVDYRPVRDPALIAAVAAETRARPVFRELEDVLHRAAEGVRTVPAAELARLRWPKGLLFAAQFRRQLIRKLGRP